MARHEFGIMQHLPRGDEDFVGYEPQKYGCINIDDDYIEALMPSFNHIPTFYHRLTQQETGLNYIGITLIPPKSCGALSEVFKAQKNSVYNELCSLLDLAEKEQKFVIHYGL